MPEPITYCFGDAVTPTRWKDIWLNEGFATYAEWLWQDKLGTKKLQDSFDEAYRRTPEDEFWQTPTADPGGPAALFDDPVYDRGAMTLHVLRSTVGDSAFFTILRIWVNDHKYGNADTAGFISLAQRVSGQDLGTLFDQSLFPAGQAHAVIILVRRARIRRKAYRTWLSSTAMAARPLNEIVEAGWARPSNPSPSKIAEMGEFLRKEIAEGRQYLPRAPTCCAPSSSPSTRSRC